MMMGDVFRSYIVVVVFFSQVVFKIDFLVVCKLQKICRMCEKLQCEITESCLSISVRSRRVSVHNNRR